MSRSLVLARLACLAIVSASCAPPPPPPVYGAPYVAPPPAAPPPSPPRTLDPAQLGTLDDRMVDFVFDGGELDFELYRADGRIVQIARSRYVIPIVMAWTIDTLDNAEGVSRLTGVTIVPPAAVSGQLGPAVEVAELRQLDRSKAYKRQLTFRARFGDPSARPEPYAYGLPYPHGLTFVVLQGPHGRFSHKGSNEYAVDFDCPVATRVVAARPGVVVAANAAAQGAGTTPEYLDYKRTNFILIRHDDGTLGEYMHLAPSGIAVKIGEHVARGQMLALSGNTGFSSTPHLHFQVMTAGPDGVSARSFPFQLAVAPDRVEDPVQGQRYAAWE